MTQLRQEKPRFDQAKVRIVLVGLGTVAEAAQFAAEMRIEFTIVCDPEKKLYEAFDLKRMSLLDLASPSLFLKGGKALLEGHKARMTNQDVWQLPGVFIFDREGQIRFSHYARTAADHPSPVKLLRALAEMTDL